MHGMTNEGEGEPRYWPAPVYLAEKLNRLPVEFVLLLLQLYYHAWKTDDEWTRVPIAQLAAEAGLSVEKARTALSSLLQQGVVEQHGERFGLTPAAGEAAVEFPPLPEA